MKKRAIVLLFAAIIISIISAGTSMAGAAEIENEAETKVEDIDFTQPGINISLEDINGTNISEAMGIDLSSFPYPEDIACTWKFTSYNSDSKKSSITGKAMELAPTYTLQLMPAEKVYKLYESEFINWFESLAISRDTYEQSTFKEILWIDPTTVLQISPSSLVITSLKALDKHLEGYIYKIDVENPKSFTRTSSVDSLEIEMQPFAISIKTEEPFEDLEADTAQVFYGLIPGTDGERDKLGKACSLNGADIAQFIDIDEGLCVGDKVAVDITTPSTISGAMLYFGTNFIKISIHKID